MAMCQYYNIAVYDLPSSIFAGGKWVQCVYLKLVHK